MIIVSFVLEQPAFRNPCFGPHWILQVWSGLSGNQELLLSCLCFVSSTWYNKHVDFPTQEWISVKWYSFLLSHSFMYLELLESLDQQNQIRSDSCGPFIESCWTLMKTLTKKYILSNTEFFFFFYVYLHLFQNFCDKNLKLSEKTNYSLLDYYAGLDTAAWTLNTYKHIFNAHILKSSLWNKL